MIWLIPETGNTLVADLDFKEKFLPSAIEILSQNPTPPIPEKDWDDFKSLIREPLLSTLILTKPKEEDNEI